MNRPVVPLVNLQRRLPEAGRIRTGVKSGRAMKAIATFRFTSADETAIEQVAVMYGGKPAPWTDAPTPGQWEVITEASEIRIVLPPDPLGGTPLYESWSGGGCQRRCDGLTAQVIQTGPDGAELTDVPCICSAKQEMVCTPHTRLSVILPEVRFAGTWRYESATSWNVATELPGMVELIQSLQARGLTRARLAIEHRKSVFAGTTRRFTIPVLRIDETMDGLASGAARVGAVASGDVGSATLPPGAAALSAGDDGDGIVDAEVVDDPMSASQQTALAEAIAVLDEAGVVALKAWWHDRGLPKIDRLTAAQANDVIGHIRAQGVGDGGDTGPDLPPEPALPPPPPAAHNVDGGTGTDPAIGHTPDKQPVPPPPPPLAAVESADDPMSAAQSKALHAAMRRHGVMADRRHDWLTAQLQRPITSAKDLSRGEASTLIDRLASPTSDEAAL